MGKKQILVDTNAETAPFRGAGRKEAKAARFQAIFSPRPVRRSERTYAASDKDRRGVLARFSGVR